jgi:hypothetical protein
MYEVCSYVCDDVDKMLTFNARYASYLKHN